MEHELRTFLKEAHMNTFANAGAKKSEPLRPASKDYHFEKGGFVYHDTYFGGTHFMGEEIIYKDGCSIWGMNYYGTPASDDIAESDIDAMLRPALMQEPWDELPVRGPHEFVEGSREYHFDLVRGDFNNFLAEERILLDGSVIYTCTVHGGLIV